MCKDLTVVKLNVVKLPKEITIGNDWLELRKRSVNQAEKVLKIDNQIDFEDAELAMKRCSTASSSLEKVRKELVKPFNKMSKDIKKMTDEARSELEEQKTRLKVMIADYMDNIKQQQEEEQQQIAEIEMNKGAFDDFIDDKGKIDFEIKQTQDVTKTLIKTRDHWTWEVENESLIPRDFMCIDVKKLNAYVRANKEYASVAGIKVVNKPIVY